jgi:uncharacterized protein GlcG (DUF336 family)
MITKLQAMFPGAAVSAKAGVGIGIVLRMDDAVAGGVDIALGTAAAAARFGVASEQLARWYGDAVTHLNPVTVLGVPGGMPLREAGRIVGGLGVGGVDPADCADLVRAVLKP